MPPSSLADLLQRIGQVPDFTGILVTDANTLGLFKTRPLHVAAVWGDCAAIELLVQAGASIDERGEHGFTPLMEATAQGHLAACQLLVALGAHPVPNDDGELPSECASIGEHPEVSQWLRANGF
jgi:uncharacterized protein